MQRFCRRRQRQRNRSRKKGKSTLVKSSLLSNEGSNPYNANSPQEIAIELYVCINIFSRFLTLFCSPSFCPHSFHLFLILLSPLLFPLNHNDLHGRTDTNTDQKAYTVAVQSKHHPELWQQPEQWWCGLCMQETLKKTPAPACNTVV